VIGTQASTVDGVAFFRVLLIKSETREDAARPLSMQLK
jgi:hypothetical protein